MYQGEFGDGTTATSHLGSPVDGYFKDPSCSVNQINTVTAGAVCGTKPSSGTLSPSNPAPYTVSPPVAFITGTPSTLLNTGSLQKGLYDDNRNLYIYFRHSDIGANPATGNLPAGPWQPGSKLNWVRTLFYNPCPVTGTQAQETAAGCSSGTRLPARLVRAVRRTTRRQPARHFIAAAGNRPFIQLHRRRPVSFSSQVASHRAPQDFFID